MKVSGYLTLFFIPLTMCCHTPSSGRPDKELFRQKLDEQHSNYIEFFTSNGSKEGIFYGVDSTNYNKVFYYRSRLDSLKWEGNKIEFRLINFVYSYTPFHENKKDTLVQADDRDLFNLLRRPSYFWGTRSPDTLYLNRTLPIYDNRSDAMDFVKVANPNER